MKVFRNVIYSEPFREALKNHTIECYRPKEKSLFNKDINNMKLGNVEEIDYIGDENWQDIFEMCIDADRAVT